jgi:hypothetical protein
MPKKTYVQLNRITLAAATSSVIFSSIPQNFRDLVLVVNGQMDTTGSSFRFNSDSGANYPQVMMRVPGTPGGGGGASSGAETGTALYKNWGSYSTGTRASHVLQIMDYSVIDKHKTTLLRSSYVGLGNLVVEVIAGRWSSNNVINTITMATGTNGFSTGFTFTLYGIEA